MQEKNKNFPADLAKSMTKQSIYLPQDAGKGRSMLISWNTFLCEVLGDQTFVPQELTTMVKFVLTNKVPLEELRQLNKSFMTKLLYALDLGFDKLCTSARRG